MSTKVLEKQDVAVSHAPRSERLLALVSQCQAGDQQAFGALFADTMEGVHRHIHLKRNPAKK